MPDLIGYIEFKIKEKNEDKLFRRWIAGPQFECSFEDFKQKLTPKRVRSDEEILDEVYKAYEEAANKGGKNN